MDKGSTIVIRHRHDYIAEGLEHLLDTNTYLELMVITPLKSPKSSETSYKSIEYRASCHPEWPNTAYGTYLFPKENTQITNPIVSTVNSPTANLAEFLDYYLQPIMKNLPAYLKDTTQFLKEIDDIKITKDTWLVMVDVKSLYTNIPNDKGIQAC